MLVDESQLKKYGVEYKFEKRVGTSEINCRDEYFNVHPEKLMDGLYCAIGNDTDGWEIEQYNGFNWIVVIPDDTYNLVITNAGLKALADIIHGGYVLDISGIKITDGIITDPETPLTTWTDNYFINKAGNLKLSIGTMSSNYIADESGTPYIKRILAWRFNNVTGGMQYTLTLPPDGVGSVSDSGEITWNVGTIGLYVKDPSNGVSDVLFAIGRLPAAVTKYGTTVELAGNKLKFYFNTILTNLGYVSNLDVIEDGEQSLPEVATELQLNYPSDARKKPYNCYVIDNLYGTNIPGLAVPKSIPLDEYTNTTTDWCFFTPSDHLIQLDDDTYFESDVKNYSIVYWNAESGKYGLAEGSKAKDAMAVNEKMPIGIRVNNNVVFSGEIHNVAQTYHYTVKVSNGGSGYGVYDELLIPLSNGLTFKVKVTAVDYKGAVRSIETVGPFVGNISITTDTQKMTIFENAIYDPRAKPRGTGSGCQCRIDQVKQSGEEWNFTDWLNKPLFCDSGDKAGQLTTTQTDSFVGWCTGANSIRLHLDLRNEASDTEYGTTRYATDAEVQNSRDEVNYAVQTAVTPKRLKDNYLQITKSKNLDQEGDTATNRIIVNTHVKFTETVVGKGVNNDTCNDDNVGFYGLAYRAYWGDLAEYYEADQYYQPGTLITIGGGKNEITIAKNECNGIISSKPGYQLGERKSDNSLPVALVGRVPVLMDGNCIPKFGDKIYLSKIKPGYASTVENGRCLGKIIEKNFGNKKLLECSVRIDF